MASSWGTSWNTSWGLSWEIDATPPPDTDLGALYAADGSLNIVIDTGNAADYGTQGIYSPSGCYRVNTTDVGPGLYAADGAFRGVISDDEGSPAPGFGLYTPTGGLRFTTSGSVYFNFPGVYARDGSTKVTVRN